MSSLHSVPPRDNNIISFPGTPKPESFQRAYQRLTHALVMDKARRGELDPAIVEALLIGAGVAP